MPNKSKQQIKQSKYRLTQDDVYDVFLHLKALRFIASGISTGTVERLQDGRFSALHTPLFAISQSPTNLGLFLDPYEAYKAIVDFADRILSEKKALALQDFHNESLRNEFIVK